MIGNAVRSSQSISNLLILLYRLIKFAIMVRVLILSLLLSISNYIHAQGIEFHSGTFEEALEKARIEEKPIFVDAYAVWCGPCKQMAKNVFTQKKVGDFFNKHFINVKMDMERGEGLTFRKKYPVSAFPTLFFIDAEGNVLHKVRGAQMASPLIKLGEFVLDKLDYSKEYAAEYEKGNRDPELILKYVKALNRSGKSSLKVANDYIQSQKDLTTPHNLMFILEAVSEADSRLFDLLIEHRKLIAAHTSEQRVRDQIERACTRTAQKALDFQVPSLHEEAKIKMKKHYPEEAKSFAMRMDLKFYLATSDVKNYLKCCEDYVKKEIGEDAGKLHQLALEIKDNFGGNSKAMKHAEKLARMATEHGHDYQHYLTYADILYTNGKKTEALEIANRSLELVKEDGNASTTVKMFIQKIEQS